jgi:dUTP pyrophosphatase
MSGPAAPPLVRVWREPWADADVALPAYATQGSAGADLRVCFPDRQGRVLDAGSRALVPTGLRVAVPPGWEMQVRPRSGLALKHGILIPNSPGTVDADYRGPLSIIVMNAGDAAFDLDHGMRIAQAVLAPAPQARWQLVERLDGTARGTGGFGHTGTR